MTLTLVSAGPTTFAAGGGEQDITTVTPSGYQVYVAGFLFDAPQLGSGSTTILRAYIGGAAIQVLEETFTKIPLKSLWLPPMPALDSVTLRWTIEPGGGWTGNPSVAWYVLQV